HDGGLFPKRSSVHLPGMGLRRAVERRGHAILAVAAYFTRSRVTITVYPSFPEGTCFCHTRTRLDPTSRVSAGASLLSAIAHPGGRTRTSCCTHPCPNWLYSVIAYCPWGLGLIRASPASQRVMLTNFFSRPAGQGSVICACALWGLPVPVRMTG